MNFVRPERKRKRRNGKKLNGKSKFEKGLTKTEEGEIAKELSRTINWMKDIKKHEAFTREWSLFVLHELVLQCMGKLPVMIHGVPINLFVPKEASKAIKLGAEINGVMPIGNSRGINNFILPGGAKQDPEVGKPVETQGRALAIMKVFEENNIDIEEALINGEIEIEAEKEEAEEVS